MPKSKGAKAQAASDFDEAYESLRQELNLKRITGNVVSPELARCAKFMTRVKPYFFPEDDEKKA